MKTSTASNATQHGIALLRISFGVMWVAHASLKLFVFTLPGTAQFFASVGFPGFLAYPIFAVEVLGGLGLIFGIYARQISMALVPIMAGAVWVHLPNGWVHTSQGGGWEYPVFLIMVSVVLWLMGDGSFALRRSNRFVPAA